MKSLKEFFNKFGTKTSSNFDLIHWAKILKIKNFRCIMRDEMKLLDKNLKLQNVMTNIHTSKQNGVHWNCFYLGEKGKYFFDSYGLDPVNEIKNYLGEGESSTFIIQTGLSQYCGQLSLYFLYLMNFSHLSFYEIVLQIVEEIQSIEKENNP